MRLMPYFNNVDKVRRFLTKIVSTREWWCFVQYRLGRWERGCQAQRGLRWWFVLCWQCYDERYGAFEFIACGVLSRSASAFEHR